MQRNNSLYFSLILLASALSALGATGLAASETRAYSDKELAMKLQQSLDVPGFSGAVVVMQEGEILFEHYAGLANREQGLEVKKDTLFNVASVAKLFTAILLDQELAKRGLDPTVRISSLDSPISPLFAEDVTVADILLHRTDIQPYEHLIDRAQPQSNAEVARLVANAQTQLIGNSEGGYSNAGFILAGELAAELAGKPYEELLKDTFGTKAVSGLAFTSMNADALAPLAIGYVATLETERRRPRRGEVLPSSYPYVTKNELSLAKSSAAGGVYATARTLAAMGDAFRLGHVGAQEAMERLCQPVFVRRRLSRGMGCWQWKEKPKAIGHAGGAPGYSAHLRIYPELQMTVAILSNHDRMANTARDKIQASLAAFEQDTPG